MRNILRLAFLVCLCCASAPVSASTINVVTTTADLKSVVEHIGGDRVKVYSLGSGHQNYHFLQAKPSYMMKAKKADLFVRVGFDLEIGYESLILEGARNPDIRVGRRGHLDASANIHPMDVPHEVDRSMGDIHAHGNPHYWLDPMNMKTVAHDIASRLSEIAPEYESEFNANLTAFNRQIDLKMAEWQRVLSPYSGEKIITYHQSWSYFAERFNLDVIGELESKPGVPPSPSHLKKIVQVVKDNHVRVILNENIYKTDAAQFIADRTSANVVKAPVSVGGTKSADDYFSLMDQIVQGVAKGFRL